MRNRKENLMRKVLFLCFVLSLVIIGKTASAAPLKDSNIDFKGLAQFIYSWDEDNGNDQFDNARLEVNLTAKPNEHITVFTSLDFSGNTSVMYSDDPFAPVFYKGNVGSRHAFMDGSADDTIVDMFADISYIDNLTFRVGQFPLPISYELNTPAFDLETIQYNQGIGTFGLRDRGLIAFGDPSDKISVAGWITNGAGAITGATNDTNDDRSSYGLQLDVFPVDYFSVKIWGMWGDQNAAWTGVETDQDAYGLGLDYAAHGFHFFTEYNYMEKDTGTTSTSKYKYRQWYAHASQKIPNTNLQAVVRYDSFRYTTSAIASNPAWYGKITTAGVNWEFEKNAKLQLMHEFITGPFDATDLQLSVKF